MGHHREVVLVVLNHADTVPPDERQPMLDDIRRLLAEDGLDGVPVLAVSARYDQGIEALRREIARRVAEKKAMRQRMAADVVTVAERMDRETGRADVRRLPRDRVARMEDALAEAAGVPTVVSAVDQSTRIRANRATGWPLVAWVSKLRPDPLKRLHLDLGTAGKQLTGTARTSVPQATPVQRARVDTDVRELAEEVTRGMSHPWQASIRRASVSRFDDLNDGLDSALAATDLGVDRIPVWAGIVRVLQWLLILAAIGGGLWLAALAVVAYLQLPELPTPTWLGIPVPTLMLVGGVGLGVVLALVCRVLVAGTARRRARSADRRLRSAISEVSRELVIEPIEVELTAYTQVRDGLDEALRGADPPPQRRG
jgi:hypothetical protein